MLAGGEKGLTGILKATECGDIGGVVSKDWALDTVRE
jgi:hypothetical protein